MKQYDLEHREYVESTQQQYRKLIRNMAIDIAEQQISQVDEFDLKKLFLMSDLSQAVGLYICSMGDESLALEYITETGESHKVGMLLANLMRDPFNQDVYWLVDTLINGATTMGLEHIAKDINEQLPYAIETIEDYERHAANEEKI